jgi:hypothetical protein
MGMRMKLLILVNLLGACNHNETKEIPIKTDTIITTPDTTQVIQEKPEAELPTAKTYGNKRFKDVTVERLGPTTFRIRGQGQIFEANFSWVVEDGHEELKKGFQMTDAGAPAWGNFDFTIDVQKIRENSTLTLILFESSPKDGSRQYELPIALE